LSGDSSQSRGRVSRERDAEKMIEHRSIDERRMASTEDQRKASAALDEARLRQQAIGVRLRQMFDEVVNEQVPDEFLEILRRADKSAPEQG
jgi:hypothetical protein